MTMLSKDKAYIVANEQQERELLKRLEKEGCSWNDTENTPPTEWHLGRYPYAIVVKADKKLLWTFNIDVTETEIVYDGRKREEDNMSDKYVVSQKFMDKLEEWKGTLITAFKPGLFVGNISMETFPNVITGWWVAGITDEECNNRLIAALRWVNGEDVFEVEKPKKWVVHELNTELYVTTYDGHTGITPNQDYITKFDTKEEAESWANSHQEVIEVEE